MRNYLFGATLVLTGLAITYAAMAAVPRVEGDPNDPFADGSSGDPFGEGGGGGDPFGDGDNALGGGPDPFGDPTPKKRPQAAEAALDAIPAVKPPKKERHQQAKPVAASVIKLAPLPKRAADAKPPTIKEHLQRKVMMSVDEVPMDEVLDALAAQAGWHLWIDRSALDDIGIASDSPITLNIESGVSLKTALWLVCGSVDPEIRHHWEDGFFQITTRDELEYKFKRHYFDVKGLVPDIKPPIIRHVYQNSTTTTANEPVEQLMELIQASVNPYVWEEVGGPASIAAIGSMLVVRSNDADETGQQLADLLGLLRKAKSWDGRDPKALSAFALPELDAWSPLDAMTTLDYEGTPLSQVVAELSKKHGVHIRIDDAGLEEIGLERDSPVTFKAKQVRLRKALQLMLREIDPDLILTPKEEIFMLTTREVSQENTLMRIYPIRDLVSSEEEVHELMEMLESSVDPETWNEVGGPGSIAYFAPSKALVIDQTAGTLEQVNDALAELRKQFAQRPSPDDAATQPTAPATDEADHLTALKQDAAWPIVVYHVQVKLPDQTVDDPESKTKTVSGKNISLEALPALVQKLIGAEQWKAEQATIELIGDRLIVRQTPQVHNQLEELLRRLDVLQYGPLGLTGGSFRGGSGTSFGF